MNTEIKTYIAETSKLLSPGKSISMTEAENRAGKFLSAMARITDWRHALGEAKIKYTSIQTAVYADQLSQGSAKTMTENKVTAEASKAFIKSREDLENVENDLHYLKAYYEIFFNAHIYNRQLAKGEIS